MSHFSFDTPFETEEHRHIRDAVRRWVQAEISPHVDQWEEAESFPVELYRKLGETGFLGVIYPEAYGGAELDFASSLVVGEELIRSGSAGIAISLGSHVIAVPPLLALGSEEQKQRFLPPVIRGEKICALGITEPGAGSDVAGIRTRAVRDGDHYVLNGAKTFITSGCRADWVTTAVRTSDDPHGGISLMVVEAGTPGFRQSSNLKKMGWHPSDTAELSFEDCRVPAANLLGEEGSGFIGIMKNFVSERLFLAVSCLGIAELAYAAAYEHARQRETFGRTLIRHQVIRHTLAEMATRIDATRTYVWTVAEAYRRGDDCRVRAAMAKNQSTDLVEYVTDRAVQVLGGYGYMKEYPVERYYRDARIFSIGGGTREIMNELIGRGL